MPRPRPLPTLATQRLVLRPFLSRDTRRVAALASDPRVARYMIHLPTPYSIEAARAWIESLEDYWRRGRGLALAVTTRAGRLIGAVVLGVERRHDRAELGYWLGAQYWGRGFAFEAARALLSWAFPALHLERVHAQYLGDNRASGRVLEKLGMLREGVRRHHIKKDGAYLDAHQYAILRSEWRKRWPSRS